MEQDIMQLIHGRARKAGATIVLPEGRDERVREAARQIERQRLATVVTLDTASFDTLSAPERGRLVEAAREARRAKTDLTEEAATSLLRHKPIYLAAAMVRAGKADGFVSGATVETADTIRPALEIIGTTHKYASSYFLMEHRGKVEFWADCAFNVAPKPNELARIAVDTAANARVLGIEPRVAFLSFSTGADLDHEDIKKVREAIQAARELDPALAVGPIEMQFDTATVPEVAARKAPGVGVAGAANVLIFPDLSAGNIAYKVAERMGGARAIGPIFQGFKRPVNDLSRGCSTADIVDVVAVTAMQAGALKLAGAA